MLKVGGRLVLCGDEGEKEERRGEERREGTLEEC